MDLLLAICTGLGLAISAGGLAGSLAYDGPRRNWLIGLAAVAGGVLFAASMSHAGEPFWPGLILGAPAGALAMILISALVAGARERAQAEPASLTLIVAGASLVLAVVSLLVPLLALVAVLALAWVFFRRGRQEARKHEGLRVLR